MPPGEGSPPLKPKSQSPDSGIGSFGRVAADADDVPRDVPRDISDQERLPETPPGSLDEMIDSLRQQPGSGGQDISDPDNVDTVRTTMGDLVTVIMDRTAGILDQAEILRRAEEIERRMIERYFPRSEASGDLPADGADAARPTTIAAFEALLTAEIEALGYDVKAWQQLYNFTKFKETDLDDLKLITARDVMRERFIDPVLQAVRTLLPAITRLLDALSRGYALELARAEFRALHDELTGLVSSREGLRDILSLEVKRFMEEATDDEVMVSLEIDYIRFKDLNTALGEANVDTAVLAPAGQKLRHPKALRAEDIKARFGGDEMTVIFTRIHKNDVPRVLERIKAILEEDQSRLPADVSRTLQVEAGYDRSQLETSGAQVQVRLGARVWSREEIAQWDMRDATRFVNDTLRPDALLATHAAKKLPDTDIVIWDKDQSIDTGVSLREATVELTLRRLSDVLVRVRKEQGHKAADNLEQKFRTAIEEAFPA